MAAGLIYGLLIDDCYFSKTVALPATLVKNIWQQIVFVSRYQRQGNKNKNSIGLGILSAVYVILMDDTKETKCNLPCQYFNF